LDLKYVSDHLAGHKTVYDLGCGTGQTMFTLHEMADSNIFYGCDVNAGFVADIQRKARSFPRIGSVVAGNFLAKDFIVRADLCLCLGVLNYVLDDTELHRLLTRIRSKTIIFRTPCSVEATDIRVDNGSVGTAGQYVSQYRTLPNLLRIVGSVFAVKNVRRAWPDALESKYGTKQFILHGTQ
jgi:SAM-dependent methyltransferase